VVAWFTIGDGGYGGNGGDDDDMTLAVATTNSLTMTMTNSKNFHFRKAFLSNPWYIESTPWDIKKNIIIPS
jgi:hypothetical protein